MTNLFQKGFSIIELLVVIAIMGIISAIAIPSYQSSLRESDVSESISVFQQAVSRAKAIAIRNEHGKFSGEPITRVCLESGVVYLKNSANIGTAPDCDVSDDNIEWQSEIKATVQVGANPFKCINFNNKGRIQSVADINCTTNQEYTFTVSNVSRTQEIY